MSEYAQLNERVSISEIANLYLQLHENNLNCKEDCGEWKNLRDSLDEHAIYLPSKICGYWMTQLSLHDQFCGGDSSELKSKIYNIAEFMDEMIMFGYSESEYRMLSDMTHRFMQSVRSMNLPLRVTVNND